MNLKTLFFVSLSIIILNLSDFSYASNYYIEESGGDDNNPGTVALAWKTIGKANSTLKAGDTVFIKAGIYKGQTIAPINSGEPGSYITFKSYNADNVIVSDVKIGINLNKRDYIIVDGINIENCYLQWFSLDDGSDHNIIKNCSFYKAYRRSSIGTAKIKGANKSNYNKIIQNIFENQPAGCGGSPPLQDCETDPADMFRIEHGDYNLVEKNFFGNCSHSALVIGWLSKYNVVRSNTFQNQYRRGLEIYFGAEWVLVENNKFYDAGEDQKNNPRKYSRDRYPQEVGSFQIMDSNNIIVRRNTFFNNGTALSFGPSKGLYFYHNTSHKQLAPISCSANGNVQSNMFKNNIFSSIAVLGRNKESVFAWIAYVQPGNILGQNIHQNNIFETDNKYWRYKNRYYNLKDLESNYSNDWYGNTFIPITTTDPKIIPIEYEDVNKKNFRLKPNSNSPAKDAGASLTKLTSASNINQVSFKVNDAAFFFDGWNIPGEKGDLIKTENEQTAKITNIDYNNNLITINSPIDIVNGEGLSLFYYGDAPDIGAYEIEIFSKGGSPLKPQNFRFAFKKK